MVYVVSLEGAFLRAFPDMIRANAFARTILGALVEGLWTGGLS
jgi:hypothetical protein